MVEPILKWAGGKRQLLAEITARFPADFDRYHEPFVGGGAVFFDLEPDAGSINDLNSRLVTLYETIRDRDPEELIAENRSHEHDEDYYYDARDEFNELHRVDDKSPEQRLREASLFVYLNRTCFNGLYRENNSGEFNVPVGRYANPDWVQADRIRALHEVLRDTTIRNGDFAYVREAATAGDLVYFDPPYEPVSTTADFTDYHAEGFDRDDQRRLRDLAVELDEAGVSVVLSNSPPVAELYEDYEAFAVDLVEATRAINSDADGRGEVAEVLITNVPEAEQRRTTLSAFE
ncbi:DNA adenine methylase [Halobaculum lipolyticum]|uniref:site-specific DNA-methyltransferase (adenine-specific) n=1 Tax=Halobaculum lipolyticum TaxID=3032001 RepID=A0ABD5WBY6_9EURY|nr:DNA adenine methylase [Halobaculum sp. DT31]